MIQIVCWKWEPFKGFRTKFTAEHVNILYDMIDRNTTIPFKFTCITDDPKGIYDHISIIPLWDEHKDIPNPNKAKKPSCYRRLKLFDKDLKYFSGRVISIDLDCVIVGNIDDILSRQEDFVGLKGTALKTAYNGGLWSLKVGSRPQVWDKFDSEQSPRLTKDAGIIGSDQGWISYVLKGKEAQYTKEDGVYSFRADFVNKRKKKLPDNAKIIMFQGGSDPWDDSVLKNYPWIKEHYYRKKEPRKVSVTPERSISCITFLWGPGPYGANYVNKLFNMIDRNLSLPHRNICFTNMPEGIRQGIEIKPLHNEWMKGNLKKAIQFDPANNFKGRVLSFDLDNVIIGSLDMFAEYTNEFIIQEAFLEKRRGLNGGNLMGFTAGFGSKLWEELNTNYDYYEKATKGYERFLYDMLIPKMSFLPKGQILSYKYHIKKGKGDLSKAKVISCHGKPKPPEIKDNIIIDNWR